MNMTDLVVLEAPFEFPEGLALSLLLRRLIMGEKAWITGSYPLSLLYAFEPNDIDVFCHGAAAPGILRLLEAGVYERDYTDSVIGQSKSANGQTSLKFKHESQPLINVIVGEFECVQDVWATFDLSCCEIAIVWDEEEKVLCLVGSSKFQTTEETKIVQFNKGGLMGGFGTERKKQQIHLQRIWKYADRGWSSLAIGSTLYRIAPQSWGFVGTWKGTPDWEVNLDNLPPLTPKD